MAEAAECVAANASRTVGSRGKRGVSSPVIVSNFSAHGRQSYKGREDIWGERREASQRVEASMNMSRLCLDVVYVRDPAGGWFVSASSRMRCSDVGVEN